MKHIKCEDDSAAPDDEDNWRRERAQFGFCRLRDTLATTPWVSASPDQLRPGRVTRSPEDCIPYFIGPLRGGASAEAPEGFRERLAHEEAQALIALISTIPPKAALTAMKNTSAAVVATMTDMPPSALAKARANNVTTYSRAFNITLRAYRACDIQLVDPPEGAQEDGEGGGQSAAPKSSSAPP